MRASHFFSCIPKIPLPAVGQLYTLPITRGSANVLTIEKVQPSGVSPVAQKTGDSLNRVRRFTQSKNCSQA